MTVKREYEVTFLEGWPTLKALQLELEIAERIFGAWTRVQVNSNGSSDPDLVEVYLSLETSI